MIYWKELWNRNQKKSGFTIHKASLVVSVNVQLRKQSHDEYYGNKGFIIQIPPYTNVR